MRFGSKAGQPRDVETERFVWQISRILISAGDPAEQSKNPNQERN
jgi:hypothetical protein